MSKRHFGELLRARFAQGKAVCVGLDLDRDKFPVRYRHRALDDVLLLEFAAGIIEATADIACAYKPNIAFYEAYGQAGMAALVRIIRFIHEVVPEVPVILDAKRADIDSTNLGYIRSAFDHLEADAITVHPYLGGRAMVPFLNREDKGIIVLCRTSNPDAGEFQELMVRIPIEDQEELIATNPIPWNGSSEGSYYTTLSNYVAWRVSRYWNQCGNCGLVVGATYPAQLGVIRRIAPNLPLLIPGIGAQGGDVEATVRNGRDSNGQGMIINNSRGILYATDPRLEALRLDGLIRQYTNA